jgi:hypothetical protein
MMGETNDEVRTAIAAHEGTRCPAWLGSDLRALLFSQALQLAAQSAHVTKS